jgi:SAM-dependent methyltransferase
MGKDFYEWIFSREPERWDKGPDGIIDTLLTPFRNIPTKIIDLGCGSGRTLDKIARPEWEVWGLDYIVTAVDVASKKLGTRAKIILADMTKTNFTNKYFDVIYSLGVFEHMDVPNFKEVARILKDDGLFICLVPIGNRGKVETQFCKQVGTPNWGTQWEWELTKEEWTIRLDDVNLKVVHFDANNGVFICRGREEKHQS